MGLSLFYGLYFTSISGLLVLNRTSKYQANLVGFPLANCSGSLYPQKQKNDTAQVAFGLAEIYVDAFYVDYKLCHEE